MEDDWSEKEARGPGSLAPGPAAAGAGGSHHDGGGGVQQEARACRHGPRGRRQVAGQPEGHR